MNASCAEAPVRVLVVHNRYKHRGGEDSVFEAEVELLRGHGHAVLTYERTNDDLDAMGALAAASATVWSGRTARELGRLLEDFRPAVVHCHNTFPLISPSVYWTAASHGVPVVQTLHNFRLACVQAMFLREGRVCEDCLGRLPWRGAVRGCYRGSVPQSAALAGMLSFHRLLGTYSRKVSRYIALNEFCRGKFIEAGLPAEKIRVKPNFVDVPAAPERERRGGLFVGRLSAEKGIGVLAEAARQLGGRLQIDVVGTGPEEALLRDCPGVRVIGWQSAEQVIERMREAAFLVMPSVWYENFPRTLVEAFACNMPVIASRMGALECLVEHGRTGLLFDPGSGASLAAALAWASDHPTELREMGHAARAHYEREYSASTNYGLLMALYGELTVDARSAVS